MRARNYVIGGLCSAVIAAQGASTPGGNDPAMGSDGLDVVPEDTLKDMRGGVDIGGLVGYFAIDRVVEVDGQVVAKMQIVVSNLDKLSTGGMPTISISGPLSELVQVMNGPAGSGGQVNGVPGAVVAAAKNLAASQSGTAAVSGARGAAGTAGLPTGAGAITQTVSLANPSTGTVNLGSGLPGAGNAASSAGGAGNGSQIQSSVQVVPQGASGSAGVIAGGSGSAGTAGNTSPENIDKIIPIGNTGQFVVVSSLPNAGAIATAVQNEVRGTTVSVQTTISAQLNSLTLLNALTLANAIRTQISLGH
jgi:hypothetical protein